MGPRLILLVAALGALALGGCSSGGAAPSGEESASNLFQGEQGKTGEAPADAQGMQAPAVGEGQQGTTPKSGR